MTTATLIGGSQSRDLTAVEQRMIWGPLYEAVLNVLGTTGVIIPMGDPNHENEARTTVTTVGGEQAVFTYSEAVTTFDIPVAPQGGPARIPAITFNGIDEEADSPDAAYWSRAAGAFSLGAWINMRDATSSTILAKFDAAGDTREYIFYMPSTDKLALSLYDESVSDNPIISSTANVAMPQDSYVFAVATYDGTADASGINIYQDGAVVASTDADDANFLDLEDLAVKVTLGFHSVTPAEIFDGQMAGGPMGPFFVQDELTPDAILRLYQLGRVALDA